jgi:rubrerythrin
MNFKGSKTEKNLLAAFAGESQARNRYTFFAKAAKNEGYEQISAIFLETADNEMEHAKRFFSFLEGGMVEIQASYPAGIIGTTEENLQAAANGEHEEWTKLYVDAASIAKEEGFIDVASQFEQIVKVEEKHEARYLKLLDNLKKKTVFKKDKEVEWKCRKCGYIYVGKEAPKTCPACKHPQSFYELRENNY